MSAAKLHPADKQRLIRALEVIDATGLSLADWQADAASSSFLNDISVERLFIDVPRELLYARAERRFDLMLGQGALAEVQALPDMPRSQPVMKAIGVPELQSHLRGDMTLVDATTAAKTATRNYIKRQLTWWRGKMAGWTSLTPGE
jgi:tRNA dimethylallyltransferase